MFFLFRRYYKKIKTDYRKEKEETKVRIFYFDESEFYEDVSPRKRIPNFISSDSEKSYDGSSRRGKEPASGRPFIKKGTSPKTTLSFIKTIHHEQKGIV